jgi:hypothetical protein
MSTLFIYTNETRRRSTRDLQSFHNTPTRQSHLPPRVMQALMKDLRAVMKSPVEGIKVSFSEDDMSTVCAELTGPSELLCL